MDPLWLDGVLLSLGEKAESGVDQDGAEDVDDPMEKLSNRVPKPMRAPPTTSAPRIPKINTSCLYLAGTGKYSKMTMNTKRLSTDSVSSTR